VAPTSASVRDSRRIGNRQGALARALHDLSPRKDRRFVAINCAAIPDTLLESELFGYEKGAYTGATEADDRQVRDRRQRHALPRRNRRPAPRAAGEAAAFPAGAGDRARRRPAGDPRGRADRLRDPSEPQDQIAAGKFREDLYYRLAEIVVEIPPLRERKGDATLLAHAFVRRIAAEQRRGSMSLLPDAIDVIDSHLWPGNVRELENVIKRAVIMSEGAMIAAPDLGLSSPNAEPAALNLRQVRDEAERAAVLKVLGRVNVNLSKAAELLGISRPTLYDLIHRFGLK
jgi:two-component system NtrC family response regulator